MLRLCGCVFGSATPDILQRQTAVKNVVDRNKSDKHAGSIWIAAQGLKQEFSAKAVEFLNSMYIIINVDFKTQG